MPSYSEIDIENAIKEVQNGISQRVAAQRYGIPRTTLRYRYEGGETHQSSHEHYQRLSKQQEGHLRDWVLTQQALGVPPSHTQLREFATRVLATHGDIQPLGKRWIEGFLRRNPEIKTVRGKGMDSARLNGANTETIQKFFKLLEIPEIKAIRQENRYNTDEHGLLEGQGSNGLVLGSSMKTLALRKQLGSRYWTTIIECVSATGWVLRPVVIFKGDSVQAQWFQKLLQIPDWNFTASINGWTSNALALRWLQEVFIPETKPAKQEARLLIVDGHGSHTTDDFMYSCYINNIYLLFLPPHTSHVLQPLDLSIFGPIKTIYRSEISNISSLTDTTPIGKTTFLAAYKKARIGAMTIKNITSGWKASGLWPVNSSKPLMSRLLAEPLKPTAIPLAAPNNLQPDLSTALTTPRHSSHISKLARDFPIASSDRKVARLLFRKIGRGLDKQNTELATAKDKIQKLELEVDHLRPKKRAKIKESPNSRYVRIAQIVEAKKRLARQLEPARLSDITGLNKFEALCHEWQLE